MSRRHDIQDPTGIIARVPGGKGALLAWGDAAPTASIQGYAPGCIFINAAGTAGTLVYVNTGTFASSTWVAII